MAIRFVEREPAPSEPAVAVEVLTPEAVKGDDGSPPKAGQAPADGLPPGFGEPERPRRRRRGRMMGFG